MRLLVPILVLLFVVPGTAPIVFGGDKDTAKAPPGWHEEVAAARRVYAEVEPVANLLAREDVAEPPAAYRGTVVEWYLRGELSVAERSALLRVIHELGPREWRKLLRSTGRLEDPTLAAVLLEIRPRIQRAPAWQLLYAMTLRGTLDGLDRALREVGKRHASPARLLETPGHELLVTILETEAYVATKFREVIDQGVWGGIAGRIEHLKELVPDLESRAPYATHVDALRTATEATLRTAGLDEAGYMGGTDAFGLAEEIADEGTCELLLDLLGRWDMVLAKFWRTSQRADLTALYFTAHAITQKGTAEQRVRLRPLLEEHTKGQRDEKHRQSVAEHLRRLRRAMEKDQG